MTSKLGVEQLLISADMKRKRKNIGKNVRAWLNRPELGMVPLFMAGDKQFFYYANKLREQTGIQLFIWAENQLERTNFKAGFCGITSPNSKQRIYRLSVLNKARILAYYASQYLVNPGYINTSIFDTLFAYASYYLIEHDYLWFYDYIPWDEATINKTLFEVYGGNQPRDDHHMAYRRSDRRFLQLYLPLYRRLLRERHFPQQPDKGGVAHSRRGASACCGEQAAVRVDTDLSEHDQRRLRRSDVSNPQCPKAVSHRGISVVRLLPTGRPRALLPP